MTPGAAWWQAAALGLAAGAALALAVWARSLRRRDVSIVDSAWGFLVLVPGLVVAAALPMARDAWTGPLPAAISLASFGALLFTRLDTLWIVLGSALAGLAGMFLAG